MRVEESRGTDEMYGRHGNGSKSHIVRDSGNNGYTDDYDNCWPFDKVAEEEEEEQRQSGANDTPPHEASSFMQSLLDLEGFCADTQRQQRRQKTAASNSANNCVCLLHQILIKVVLG